MPKIKIGNRSDSPLNTIKYIQNDVKNNEQAKYNLINNLSSPEKMSHEMMLNEAHTGSRKYYHEIISFHPKDKSKCTTDLMTTFAQDYIDKCYSKNKIYWGVHRDKEHVHIHMVVSATNIYGKKVHHNPKFNHAKDDFVQKFAKKHDLHFLDELILKKTKDTISHHEEKLKLSTKEMLKEKIASIIAEKNVKTKSDFETCLNKESIFISERQTGIVFNNKTYRFETLGFAKNMYKDSLFLSPDEIIKEDKERKKELKRLYDTFKKATKDKETLSSKFFSNSITVYKSIKLTNSFDTFYAMRINKDNPSFIQETFNSLKTDQKSTAIYNFIIDSQSSFEEKEGLFKEMIENSVERDQYSYYALLKNVNKNQFEKAYDFMKKYDQDIYKEFEKNKKDFTPQFSKISSVDSNDYFDGIEDDMHKSYKIKKKPSFSLKKKKTFPFEL